MFEREKWQSRAGRLICAAIILLGVYILLKYALGLLLPFIVAWVIGASVAFFAKKSSMKLKGSKKAWSIFYVAVFWGALFVGASFAVFRISKEAASFFEYVTVQSGEIINSVKNIVDSVVELPSKIPFLKDLKDDSSLGEVGEYLNNAISNGIRSVIKRGSEILAEEIGKLAIGTPKAAISLIICVMSSVYISLDHDKIKEYLLGVLSEKSRQKTQSFLERVVRGLKGYAKAYFLLFVINFAQLYIGLLVLGRRYAFFIALTVAALDLLPLFGAGAVLVPWSIILIANGNYTTGFGMLVLFGIMTVVRQIAEPRLVGDNLGIHPLASLASMFIGFRAFGFWGMILAPVGVLIVKEMIANSKNGGGKDRKTLQKL